MEFWSPGFAAEKGGFEGTIEATLTRAGIDASHYVFTRKGNQLRIENTTNKLEPINVMDLAANKLTIIYPHNTSFVHVDLTKQHQAQRGGPGGMPPVPPGFSQSVSTPPATSPAQIGPNLANLPSPPPGFPTPPLHIPPTGAAGSAALPSPSIPPGIGPGAASRADMPAMPSLPSGAGPGAAMPSIPMPPSQGVGAPMPAMPGMFGSPELKKGDKSRKIQGFECAVYNINSRGENFEIWATNDSSLFPFQLITRDYIGRRFGPQMLEETWPELVHNKSLFPLEATLKMDPGGQERLSFKVDKIEKKKIDDPKLFQPPEKYIQIDAPEG